MKVFLSWSGTRSGAAARAFRTWIPEVLQNVEPWLSAEDINAGARWSSEIQSQLADTQFGILFVTSTNFAAPWLLFEAGALAKTLVNTFVCPYLLDLKPTDIPSGPLTQFQAKEATERGTYALIEALNAACASAHKPLPLDRLTNAFNKWWPDFAAALTKLPDERSSAFITRSVDNMIEETLGAVRELARTLPRAVDQIRTEIRQSTARTSGRVLSDEVARRIAAPKVLSPKDDLLRKIALLEIQLRHLKRDHELAAPLHTQLAELKTQLISTVSPAIEP